MATMASLSASPIFGALLPSQEIQEMVMSYKLEMWHFAVGLVVYLGVDQLLALLYPLVPKEKSSKIHKDPFWVYPTAIVHNLLMTAYSGWTFILALQIMIPYLAEYGLDYAQCSSGLLGEEKLRFLALLFYFSKYYEFLDTWLVRAKGRKPIFLQKYHHVGAYICMGLLVEARAEPVWLFVLYNSFIHTIMYFYYFLTVIGIRPSWKMLITIMQLVQFVIGLGCTIPYFRSDCLHEPENYDQWFALTLNDVYVGVLFFLFGNFFVSTYSKPSKGASKGKKKQ